MKKISIFLSFLLVLAIFTSGFKLLDPDKNHPTLRNIHSDLNYYEIDVLQSWESNVKTEGRPVLAPIANYPVTVRAKEGLWVEAFQKKYADAIVAVEGNYRTAEKSFLGEWNKTPVDKRIFISFTKDDIKHAENIKRVLEDKGYNVFIYSQNTGEVFDSPEMIAYCMKTAGDVFVLDTWNSRNKEGVIAEALAFAKYTFKPESELIAENAKLQKDLNDRLKKVTFYSKTDYRNNVVEGLKKYYKDKGEVYNTAQISNILANQGGGKLDMYSAKNLDISLKRNFVQNLGKRAVDNSPYAYNKLLKENLEVLNASTLINIASVEATSGLYKIIGLLGICPFYKIPIALCPICSGAIR